MPGKKPASAAPSRKRNDTKLIGPLTNAIAPEKRPQVIMMRGEPESGPDLFEKQVARTSKRQ